MSPAPAPSPSPPARGVAILPLIIVAILDLLLRAQVGTPARVALIVFAAVVSVVQGYGDERATPFGTVRLAVRIAIVSIVMLACMFGVDRMAWGVYALGVVALGWLLVSSLGAKPSPDAPGSDAAGREPSPG